MIDHRVRLLLTSFILVVCFSAILLLVLLVRGDIKRAHAVVDAISGGLREGLFRALFVTVPIAGLLLVVWLSAPHIPDIDTLWTLLVPGLLLWLIVGRSLSHIFWRRLTASRHRRNMTTPHAPEDGQ